MQEGLLTAGAAWSVPWYEDTNPGVHRFSSLSSQSV